MADISTFRGVIDFFQKVGLYDVVLPFILVFTIVFAILEKTKVLGMEKDLPRKNLNAMVAFVIAFLVVASSKLVEIITTVSSQIVILLILSILFLLLVGSFREDAAKGFLPSGGWQTFFMFIMFIGIVMIFLGAIKTDQGNTWLQVFWNYVSQNGQGGNAVGSIILLIMLILLMFYVIKEPSRSGESKKKD